MGGLPLCLSQYLFSIFQVANQTSCDSRDSGTRLKEFRDFYNSNRLHAPLGGDTPVETSVETVISITYLCQFGWRTHCRGLLEPARGFKPLTEQEMILITLLHVFLIA